MVSSEFDSVDEACRQSFEADWSQNRAGPIEDYLPEEGNEKYVGTAEELIHIDLEFRWKRFGEQDPDARDISASPPSIEDYVRRFPALFDPDVLSRLVQAEYELRSRYNDSPSVDEYRSRFPELAKSGVKLEDVLDEELGAVVSVSQLKPGQSLGRYRLVGEQGRGGFAAVWRADDSKLGRRIALKRLSGHLARQSESRRRFVNEARVTARLEHPGIVPIYDMGNLEDEHAYYTMRLIRGNTLEDAINAVYMIDREENECEFAIKFRELISSLIDICDTIEYCHAQGIIHRDLKPQNIICGDYGETIVLDWGLARRAEALRLKLDSVVQDAESNEDIEATRFGTIKGTPAFMAPEQAAGQVDQIDQRSDIYALGAILYQILTNQTPFRGTVEEVLEKVRSGQKAKPSAINSNAPKAVESICLRAMQVSQDDRYQNVADFANDLKRWQADEKVSAHKDTWWESTTRWIRKHKTLSASIALTLFFAVIAAAIGNVLWQQHQFRLAQSRAETRSIIDTATAESQAELSSSRFSSAYSILDQAYQLVKNKNEHVDKIEEIRRRRDRTKRIVDFYEYSSKAYELTFLDQLEESAIYSQEALRKIGALDHVDWWVHLPNKDLNAMQKDRLQTEVYRVFCTLAVMRGGQSLNQGFDVAILLNPDAKKAEHPELLAASYAASRADAFRPAECLRMVREYSDFVRGKMTSIPKLPTAPLNATDAGIMGSILDTNTPTDQMQRTALQFALGGRDPYETAKSWMAKATAEAPDWYWTSIFLAQSEIHAKNFELSIRSYSHSIGLDPDYWVGYAYRALAYTGAAQNAKSNKVKQQHLRAATLDIERARELAPNQSELYWMAAFILSLDENTRDQSAQYFLRALWRHPKSNQIGASHFSGVTRYLFGAAQDFTTTLPTGAESSADITRLKIALAHWKGDNQQALALIEKNENDLGRTPLIVAIKAMIELDSSKDVESNIALLQSIAPQINQWHVWYALGMAQRNNKSPNAAMKSIEASAKVAFDARQKTRSYLEMAELSILLDNQDAAIKHFDEAVQADIALDCDKLLKIATDHKATELLQQVNAHLKRVSPILPPDQTSEPIGSPALLNGDFELGIASYWSAPALADNFATWGTTGNRQMIAESFDTRDVQGKVLHVRTIGTGETGYGATEQTFPVSPNQKYKISIWCKGNDLNGNGLRVIDTKTKNVLLECRQASADWQQFTGEFSPQDNTMTVRIQFESDGEIWIDQLEIKSM